MMSVQSLQLAPNISRTDNNWAARFLTLCWGGFSPFKVIGSMAVVNTKYETLSL